MVLNYIALVMIIIVVIGIFYTFIYIHELPYEAAKHRNHPHQDAIWVACWLSLFTLHAIWPLVFIWALTHKEKETASESSAGGTVPADLSNRLTQLETRLRQLEGTKSEPAKREPVQHG
jgi:hypothetical protein